MTNVSPYYGSFAFAASWQVPRNNQQQQQAPSYQPSYAQQMPAPTATTTNNALDPNKLKGYGMILAGLDLLDDNEINGSSLKKAVSGLPQGQQAATMPPQSTNNKPVENQPVQQPAVNPAAQSQQAEQPMNNQALMQVFQGVMKLMALFAGMARMQNANQPVNQQQQASYTAPQAYSQQPPTQPAYNQAPPAQASYAPQQKASPVYSQATAAPQAAVYSQPTTGAMANNNFAMAFTFSPLAPAQKATENPAPAVQQAQPAMPVAESSLNNPFLNGLKSVSMAFTMTIGDPTPQKAEKTEANKTEEVKQTTVKDTKEWGDPHYVVNAGGKEIKFDHKGKDNHTYNVFNGDNFTIDGLYVPYKDPKNPQVIGTARVTAGQDELTYSREGVTKLNGNDITDGEYVLADQKTKVNVHNGEVEIRSNEDDASVFLKAEHSGITIKPEGEFRNAGGILGEAILNEKALTKEECEKFDVTTLRAINV